MLGQAVSGTGGIGQASSRSDGVLWAILGLAAILLFWGLGDRSLWQDEAETALLGKNILHFGRPLAFDGANVISQEASKEFGPDYLWRWSPWIQLYIAAGSFAVLGPTTLAARLPFTVLAFLAIPLTYRLARRLFDSIAAARLSALFLALSAPFLLYARQSRWHGPAYLLLACLLLCLDGMRRGRWPAVLGFAVCAAIFFYTNFFVAIGVLAALAAATLAAVPAATPFYRPDRRLLVSLATAYALTAAACLPGLLFFNSFREGANFDPARVYQQLAIYSAACLTFVLPLPVIIVLVYFLLKGRVVTGFPQDWRQSVLFLLAFSLAYVLYLSLGPWMMFRYMTVLLVPAALLIGVAVYGIMQWNRVAGVVVVLLLICTNAIHLLPLGYLPKTAKVTYSTVSNFPSVGPVGFPLACYLCELVYPIKDSEAILADYLREHASRNDVVLAQYGDLPLQFYTGLRVIGGMQGQPLPTNPDWIVQRGFVLSPDSPGKDGSVRDFILSEIPGHEYMIVLTAPDLMLGNSPEPQFHLYRRPPATVNPPAMVLWHRK
jgi:4-amino-4-deoxy-L-arabinose transferase-like glycosyltransferase